MKNSQFLVPGCRTCATLLDTQQLGEELGRAVEAGDLVILDGPLGAGKTSFTQGIARGMQVKGRVTSPTFIIAREHHALVGGPALIHVDAYRLLDTGTDPLGELDALDLDTDLADAVVVAEWGAGLVEQLEQDYLLVQIDRESGETEDTRTISWGLNAKPGE